MSTLFADTFYYLALLNPRDEWHARVRDLTQGFDGNFVVMEREGISEALTGDHHFEQAGFNALLKG